MAREGRVPVSIVCVYNDPAVLASCLERSVDLGRAEAPEVELIAVDNAGQRFASAGAALNHGARRARHDVVAFVHQDVYLHSLARLETAAGFLLANPDVGMLGAVGTTATGRVLGVVRDRVVMIGDASDGDSQVDSLDEVLFLLRRDDVLASPLTEDPELAWHAYAVEYCARVHALGRRVLTADVMLTHNSMTVNLDRLSDAHHRVAALYPELVPLQTTCGVVRAPDDRSALRTLARRRRGLATWFEESQTARRLARLIPLSYADVVLGDVRLGVDDALDLLAVTGLDVVNVERDPSTEWDATGLMRRGRDVTVRQVSPADLAEAVRTHDPGRGLLLTGRFDDWVSTACATIPPEDRLVGFARDTGVWVLTAPGARRARSVWPSWRNRAVGARRSQYNPSQRSTLPVRIPRWRRATVHVWGAAVGLSDLAPPGIRYGYLHPLARRLFARPLPVLSAVRGVEFEPGLPRSTGASTDVSCVLIADHLDIGGVGRVVEMLAEGLGHQGVQPVVLCPGDGERTLRLRTRGIEVVIAKDGAAAREHLERLRPDVIQLHSAPDALVEAALDVPAAVIIPVLHNTEIHYNGEMWARADAVFKKSARVIAVSDVVRRFHLQHLPATPGDLIVVVPNGAMPASRLSPDLRGAARQALERVVGTSLVGTTVFVCLARYDSQKNIAGLVAAFLRSDAGATLVVAGDPSDWLEFHRARAVAAAHPSGHLVHLLGSSDAATLLAAADAFVLDSFFEGWPLATTEAVAVGLPILVSETGGARELVARAVPGSVCVSNATGPAEAVTDARVRRARRSALRQRNADELASAVRRMSDSAGSREECTNVLDASYAEMVAAHAGIIRACAGREGE